MARIRQSDLIDLWRTVEQAGGVRPYVEAQLAERGFVVQRRETDKMSDREKDAYKKSLKAEAEERRRLSRAAWEAHKDQAIQIQSEEVYERYMKYLIGCAKAFRIGYTDCNQFTLEK